MKKKVIAIVLTAIMISSVCAFPASAMNGKVTVDGKTFSYVLNWNSSYNGAYASSAYGSTAYYLKAYVYYEYSLGGRSHTTFDTKAQNNVQSVSANVSVAGSSRVHTESTHVVKSTSASSSTTRTFSLY